MTLPLGNLAEIDFELNPYQKLRLALLIPAYQMANPGVDPIKVADAMVTWIREGEGSLEGLCNERRACSGPGALVTFLNAGGGSGSSGSGTPQPN